MKSLNKEQCIFTHAFLEIEHREIDRNTKDDGERNDLHDQKNTAKKTENTQSLNYL